MMKYTLAQRQTEHRAELYRNLIRHEAKIGGELFGNMSGGRREFFCFDERTWIWHEEWIDINGFRHQTTTRYDVRPKGIYKAQDGQQYTRLSKTEAGRLKRAAEAYKQQVFKQMYRQVIYLS
ncbi:MAG TPA: hypothetical protein VLF39_02320 [Candidatus Saccharimonadales bacterium]|nr:hypothetical protein [Candidatus Saccharimonadales bacterium]